MQNTLWWLLLYKIALICSSLFLCRMNCTGHGSLPVDQDLPSTSSHPAKCRTEKKGSFCSGTGSNQTFSFAQDATFCTRLNSNAHPPRSLLRHFRYPRRPSGSSPGTCPCVLRPSLLLPPLRLFFCFAKICK